MDSNDASTPEVTVHYFRGQNLEADQLRPIRDILKRWSDGDVGALTGSTRPLVENDMRAVALCLSPERLGKLDELVRWMDRTLEPECWGSPSRVSAWAARHRG